MNLKILSKLRKQTIILAAYAGEERIDFWINWRLGSKNLSTPHDQILISQTQFKTISLKEPPVGPTTHWKLKIFAENGPSSS